MPHHFNVSPFSVGYIPLNSCSPSLLILFLMFLMYSLSFTIALIKSLSIAWSRYDCLNGLNRQSPSAFVFIGLASSKASLKSSLCHCCCVLRYFILLLILFGLGKIFFFKFYILIVILTVSSILFGGMLRNGC